MGRKNSPSAKKKLATLITHYEEAKAENRQLYLDADQLADIADWYAFRRKFEEAQEVITYGLKIHPGNTDLLIEQAYLYLDTQKPQKAKKVADSITEDFDSEVKLLKAELLLNEGKLEEAQWLLNTIEDADELATITDVVFLYLDTGYPEAAKEWIDRGKSRYAENEEYMALTADYLTSTHQMEPAITYYNKLIDQSPFNPSYWLGLVRCYFIQEQIDKAIEACDFALAADDQYGEAYAYKAHCFFYLNNPDDAIKNYQKAIEFKAIPPELGYMFMGISYGNKEEWQKANEYYDKVIACFEEAGDKLSILLIDTYTSKAFALSRLSRYEEAHESCEKAKEINPNEGLIYLTEGKLYLTEGLEDEAAISFDKAIKTAPDIEMWYMVASAYSENDYLPEAKEYFEKVYRMNPKYEDVTKKLSVLSLMYGEIDNFFKYNKECEQPLEEDTILKLLNCPEHMEEDKRMLKEVWERMKKEKKNTKGKK
ncbi:tetratricopeptide repeat protein [Bacteroides sp. AN502(2024)]|uniref:tetratricopeptide repeat protein n=1 Tax=Bacteroides sp. AN502(2024) TaxID=3160599 RepID=UPI0035146C75